jgi:hypothetical protein
VEEPDEVLLAPHAAADGERREHPRGGPLHQADERSPVLLGGGDVEVRHLVGALGVVAGSRLDGVPRVTQVLEVHPLHDAAVLHVEAGDDALRGHVAPL